MGIPLPVSFLRVVGLPVPWDTQARPSSGGLPILEITLTPPYMKVVQYW